jgi:class 3 adenylate cyclase/tetratricopeptide (TPR) repeat protein
MTAGLSGTVTIMVTDVVGSTDLHAVRGDAEAIELLKHHDAVIREHVEAGGGRVVKSMGDGVLATFPSAGLAVKCAVGIQTMLWRKAREEPRDALSVRIGLHVGDTSQEDGDIHGAAVNAAVRIAARAAGGEVLISDLVRQLTGPSPELAFRDRGRLKLKGFPERWRLHLVVVSGYEARQAAAAGGLVGRKPEKTALERCLQAAQRGEGGMVLISGEAGIGKTRLARETAAMAEQMGFKIFTGRCFDVDRQVPYLPIAEILNAMADSLSPAQLRQALGEGAPEVARLIPQLNRRFPDLPQALEMPAEQSQSYLFGSVIGFIANASTGAPHLLIMEDLHWADESTLRLLQQLAARLQQHRVLVVCTQREVGASSAALASTVAGLLERREASSVSLRPLREEEVATLIRNVAGKPAPASLVRAVNAVAEGNPFFTEELFRHLSESRRIQEDGGRFRGDFETVDFGLPDSVRLVIAQRLTRLGENARRLLGVAALVGRDFPFDLVALLVDLEEDQLLDALDEAERARLLVSADVGGEPGYRFAHELIRQALIADISVARRQRLHLRIAHSLEQLHPEDLAADISYHLREAGTLADAATKKKFLAMAGERALDSAAYTEAAAFFETALELWPAADKRGQAEVLLRLGRASRSLGLWERTFAVWDQALALLEEQGDVEAVAALCWEAMQQFAWAIRPNEAMAMGQRGLRAIGDRDLPERIKITAYLANMTGLAGNYQEAQARLAQIRGLVEKLGSAQHEASLGYAETLNRWYFLQMPEVVEIGQKTMGQLRDAGELWNLADVMGFVGSALATLGRFTELDELYAELGPLAQRIGHVATAGVIKRTSFAVEAARAPDLPQLETLALAMLEMAQGMSPAWLALTNVLAGTARFWRGDWEKARAHYQEAARLAVPGMLFGSAHGFLALVLAYLGDAEQAFTVIDSVADTLPVPGQPSTKGAWHLGILAAEAAGIARDRERAKRFYPLVASALDTGVVAREYDGRLVRTAAGLAAAAAGLQDLATEHFEVALSQAQRLPHRLERPHIELFYGRMLADERSAGARVRAAGLLQSAENGFMALGMPQHQAMARSARESAGIQAEVGAD